jgi:uncharacterized membrane protein
MHGDDYLIKILKKTSNGHQVVTYVSPLEQSVFVQLFLSQMTQIKLVVLLVYMNILIVFYEKDRDIIWRQSLG